MTLFAVSSMLQNSARAENGSTTLSRKRSDSKSITLTNSSNYTKDIIMTDRRAIEVLEECAELMRAKGKAYNRVPQAEYYPHGVLSIWTMMHQKMTRLKSLMDHDGENQYESMEDSARDLINYTAFLIEFMEGKMDGQ